jgi:hypothetical protein
VAEQIPFALIEFVVIGIRVHQFCAFSIGNALAGSILNAEVDREFLSLGPMETQPKRKRPHFGIEAHVGMEAGTRISSENAVRTR